jgi:YD repeat-containing protein
MCCRPLKIYVSALILLLFLAFFSEDNSFAKGYSYDNLNRLTQVQYDSSATIKYTYDAMGNLLTVTRQGPHASPTPPQITSIVPGYQKATIYFSLSTPAGNALIASYTATCTANGEITRSSASSGSPITVQNLTIGIQYTCSVTATDSDGFNSEASAQVTVTPVASTTGDDFNLLLLLPAILKNASNEKN